MSHQHDATCYGCQGDTIIGPLCGLAVTPSPVQDEAPKALTRSRRDVAVDLARYTRSMAGCRGTSALEMLGKARTETDPINAAVLAMYAGSYAAEAFTFARMALDYATKLGWYPATFVNSDWWLTGPPAAALGASRPSPARPMDDEMREAYRLDAEQNTSANVLALMRKRDLGPSPADRQEEYDETAVRDSRVDAVGAVGHVSDGTAPKTTGVTFDPLNNAVPVGPSPTQEDQP